MPVPSQLRQWHNEIQAVKRARPDLSHGEAMALASAMRKGKSVGAKKKGRKPKGKKGGNVGQVLGTVASFLPFLL